ncbi:SDR family NAD(P)-dependent oxidoreductase [Paracoccus sp. SY]|uniref:SDR family NAD(P)-dependent oxidoreductase n=1 Tax=Paracoccus sp. SY TaxID=1330255 RepID=UPI001960634F|nr:SDR family oxidoreductase [Paracoccus sp. SY]
MQDWLELKDATCIITGATGGLGRATALGFLRAGARVALLDRAAEVDEGFRADLDGTGSPWRLYAADVRDKDQIRGVAGQVAADLGKPSVLVNNAALSAPAPLAETELDRLQNQFAVNLGGYLQCAQVFCEGRDPGRPGSIINIASIAGRNAQAKSGGYSSTKAAILMLSQQMAVEWGPEGIRTNSVSPGLFLTPMTQKFYADPEDRRRREEVVPLRRIGDADELANAVLFLASPRSSYVNGAEIIVDGGFSQTLMSHIPRAYGR